MSDWVKVCHQDDIDEDEGFTAEVDGTPVGVFRIGDECFALNDICTHAHAHLSEGWVEDDCVLCPLHQARFDLRTGKSLDGIAPEDAKTYECKVEDGEVYVKIG